MPENAVAHAVLLGRDSWSKGPARRCRDVSDTETIVTFKGQEREFLEGNLRFAEWVECVVGMVETTEGGGVDVCPAGARHWSLRAMSWITLGAVKIDCTIIDAGRYYILLRTVGCRGKPLWKPDVC